MLRVVLEDILFAIRGLLKRRGFTPGAILTLALGIGANSAIFSVVNAVLLSDLPYKDPSRLMIIWNDFGKTGQSLPRVSVPDFIDYQEEAQTLEGFAAAIENVDTITGDGQSQHVDKSMVTPSFFALLGVNMQLGRNFLDEEAFGGPRIVILSHRLWQSRFGGRRDLVGQSIQMNGIPYTVVGVLPEWFKWYCLILIGSLGAAALLLAVLGIYGVMAYCVAQRTSEYGIRMALGAAHADILRSSLGEGAKLISIGIVIGLAGAMALTPAMSGLLFGVKPADPLTLAGVSIVLGAAGLSACYLPALRASRVDPLQALGRQ